MKQLIPIVALSAMVAGYAAGVATTWTVSAQTPASQVATWGKVPLAPEQAKGHALAG